MAPHESLKAWQHAKLLAIECGKLAKTFPPEEQHALAEQLRRAAYSVPLNIAEGAARKGTREFRRFLDTSRGSLSEVQTALELAHEMSYLRDDQFERVNGIATETARTLWGLLRKVSDASRRHPDS